MSIFLESFSRSEPTNGAATQLELDMRKRWPTVADALFGVTIAGNASASFPSCSIILFVEGDRLKYCLTPQGKDRVAFGTISTPLDGLDGLESSLAAGDFAWRAKRGKR